MELAGETNRAKFGGFIPRDAPERAQALRMRSYTLMVRSRGRAVEPRGRCANVRYAARSTGRLALLGGPVSRSFLTSKNWMISRQGSQRNMLREELVFDISAKQLGQCGFMIALEIR